MRLKHFDYIKLVVEDYNDKKAKNILSPRLSKPTPAGLKNECLMLYEEGHDKKDEPTLRTFFGPIDKERDLLHFISIISIDKFKPLVKYLNGDTTNTDHKNIELLAWLIDFEHRPFNSDKEISLSKEQTALISLDEEATIFKGEDTEEEKWDKIFEQTIEAPIENLHTQEKQASLNEPLIKPVKNKKRNNVIAALAIAAVGAAGVFGINSVREDKGCMYWNGERYERIACDETADTRMIIPLDTKRMKNFQKITRPDTLSRRDIGKVFYIKNSNTIECYTQGGAYPEDPRRSLKKISEHIFETYLEAKDSGKPVLDEEIISPEK